MNVSIFKNKCETPLFAVACRFEGGKGKENITGLTGLSLVDFDHIVSPSATDSHSAEFKRNINREENMSYNLPSEFRLSSADKEKDYIRELAATVRVKGGEQEQVLWYRYLKKWLVGMVASWLSDDVMNNVTMPSIDERAAYAHYHEHRKHIASFCGTGNNTQFLSDPTGNRRWLPFEVESIVSPREHPFNYEGVYAQALALYKSGFQFWFTKEEIQELNRHNRRFETPRLEQELVDLYFRKSTDSQLGEFMSVARALQIISNGISQKLCAVNVGRAFSDLGFKRVRTNSCRGFIVVCRTAEEIKTYQHRLLADAQPDTSADLPF